MIGDDLIVTTEGKAGVLALNRPQALNALSLQIIRGIVQAMDEWRSDSSIEAVVIRGAGERAFCAGGDIKAAHAMGRNAIKFFAEEYRMNRMLFHYPKPIFAFMHGITMGGGFGIAGPCRFRIATDNSVFAMPEVGIGFFPDVGSAYFLSRCPGQAGTFMAVTGQTINVSDMMAVGISTHYVPRSDWESCINALTERPDVKNLESFADRPSMDESMLVLECNRIDKIFNHNGIESIVDDLHRDNSVWAREMGAVIARRSPTSLKVALRHVRMAAQDAFDDVIERDFTLAQHFLEGREFYEGIRAAVIDKDRNPQWNPASLEEVDSSYLVKFFHKTKYNLDNV